MELYLMQHGACFSKEVNPEQPLSPVGREWVEKSARAMAYLGLTMDHMVCSTKLRSFETAEVVAEQLRFPVSAIKETDTAKPMAPPHSLLQFLGALPAKSRVFVAGHLPSLNEFTSLVITNGSKAAVNFENAGLMRLDVLDFKRPAGSLIWYIPPSLLHLLHR